MASKSDFQAIYYFLVDYHTLAMDRKYSGEYDNLLYLFKFMFGKIHQLYDKSSLRSYNWRHDHMEGQQTKAEEGTTCNV